MRDHREQEHDVVRDQFDKAIEHNFEDRDKLLAAADKVLRHWDGRHCGAAWYSDLAKTVAEVRGR